MEGLGKFEKNYEIEPLLKFFPVISNERASIQTPNQELEVIPSTANFFVEFTKNFKS